MYRYMRGLVIRWKIMRYGGVYTDPEKNNLYLMPARHY